MGFKKILIKRIYIPKLQMGLFKRILLVNIFFLFSVQAFAHGDLVQRIEEKSKEILKSPNDFALYFERGLLYQQHQEYNNALKDYSKSKYLGNKNKVLLYRIAEVNCLKEHYKKALNSITTYLEIDSLDVKARKLEAQIQFNLGAYKKAIKSYNYVINTMVDIRPEDILEYANIILTESENNYRESLEVIEFGLNKLGANTLSLQLKKLEYLENSNQAEQALQQYNYFINEYKRKEFWYYKKAEYLTKINKIEESNISLKLAKNTIQQLGDRFRNMNSIIELKQRIKSLEDLNNIKL